jgi:hypothetical protein
VAALKRSCKKSGGGGFLGSKKQQQRPQDEDKKRQLESGLCYAHINTGPRHGQAGASIRAPRRRKTSLMLSPPGI